jgi:sodium-dependent phosphate transporter
MVAFPEYLWMAVVGSIFAFIYAFGIGANDVANAFASTVASKSLTLKQAIIAAGICEFAGAISLGAAVTSTIRSKIFDVKIYDGEEDILLLGMFTSLMTAIVMLLGATYIALPVSTTQTVVGTIMGFSIAAKGFDSINREVVIQILLSWIMSPGISGAVAFLFFGFIKVFIHNSASPFDRGYILFPVVLTVFIGIDLFFVIYKAVNTNYEDSLKLSWVLPASFGSGAFCGLIWLVIVGPWAKKRIEAHMAELEELAHLPGEEKKVIKDGAETPEKTDEGAEGEPKESSEEEVAEVDVEEQKKVQKMETPAETPAEDDGAKKSFFAKAGESFANNTYKQDLAKQSFHENKRAEDLWQNADKFDVRTEQLFTYVQVFTACMNSFAHGANDVANSIAPISAILMIYQDGELSSKAGVQKWLLAYGGIAIVVGLVCYGYKVMKTIGYKLTALSPSRGACAELAASLYVVTASFLEMPVSSTQCIVGAVCGVGLVGGVKNLGWWFFLKICIGWVCEFFLAATLSAGMFSIFAFSPSLMCDN